MSGLVHYRYIDALRGVAFLGVMSVHVTQQAPPYLGGSFAAVGVYGVQLFFLLSAITLLRSMAVRAGKERTPLRNFYTRRLFRIAPLFWFAIGLYLAVDGFGPGFWAPGGRTFWDIASTALFLHGWTPHTINSVVPGGWSIAVEMTFYAVLPFLAARVRSLHAAVWWALGATVAGSVLFLTLQPWLMRVAPEGQAYLATAFLKFWFPAQLPVFMLGFVAYFCLHSPSFTRFLSQPGIPMLLLATAILGTLALMHTVSAVVPLHVLESVLFVLLIFSLAAKPLRLVVNRVVSGIGTLSYSCYVLHFAMLRLADGIVQREWFGPLPDPFGPQAHFLALWFATLALSITGSLVTYNLIERPGILLGNRLISRWESREPVTAARAGVVQG
jgi:peptidoglycan/LPS O-acetylase OafA/YrhL